MAFQIIPLLGPLASLGRFFVSMFTSFKAWFAFWFVTHIGDLALTALYSVGAGYAVYELGSFGLNTLYSEMTSRTNAMPQFLLIGLNTAGVFDAISVIFGGFAASMAMRGFINQIRRSRMSFGKPEDWIT